MNIAERGVYWARWRPFDAAIRASGDEVSWGAMGDVVPRLAGGLRERGVEPGDRVGILAANSVEFCQLALAIMHAGAILVPLNIRLAPPELGLILEHSGCRAVAVDSSLAPLFGAAPKPVGAAPLTIGLDQAAPAEVAFIELAAAAPVGCAERAEGDVAVLGYTSGTTGLPKGVMLTHGNLAAAALQTIAAENSTGERRTLLCVPLAFTGGIVNNFLMTYLAGGMLVLEPGFVPDRVVELLQSERITTLFAVPVMWQAIASTDGFAAADLSALSTAITGGAPVPAPLLNAFLDKGVAVRQAYALTEATGSCCLLPASMALTKTSKAGMPNVHTSVSLVDDEGVEVAVGEIGEITIRGPQVMRGYWNDDAATADAVRDGWLHTGDLGRLDAEGLLEVVDRKKSMFISGGLNVYPAEIERVLDAHPEVAESAAFGLAHERWGEACAVVVRGVAGTVDEEALIAHCRAQLSDYKVPKTVIQTSEPLPRGMSGKIVRGELAKLYVASVAAP
jgi:fatty-acyl-CoA synthase